MRLFLWLFIFVITEAKREQPTGADSIRHKAPLPKPRQGNPYSIYSKPIAVDFIHMGKQGILDPMSGLKTPFDGLGFDLRYPTSPEEELKMLRNASPNTVVKLVKNEKTLPQLPSMEHAASIRQYNPELEEIESDMKKEKIGKNKEPTMFDFETIQNLNVASQLIYRSNIAKSEAMFRRRLPPGYNETEDMKAPPNVRDFFGSNSFQLEPAAGRSFENWSTCDDFAKNARFHPRDVAGVKWVAFYVWTPSSFPGGCEFSFSYPTLKTVQEYRTKYGQHVNKTIDWKQPMLLLKSWVEILLVAAERRGLFYGIPKFNLPEHIKDTQVVVPHITMGIKTVDPYLAIMLCEERIAFMLAVSGEEPEIEDREREAKKLGFNGIGKIIEKYEEAEGGVPSLAEEDKTLLEEDEEVDREQDMRPRRPSPFFHDDPTFSL